MRTILVVIYFTFVTIVSFPLYFMVYLIGKKDPMKIRENGFPIGHRCGLRLQG